MTFRFNEGEINLPEGWEDKSVIALSYPAGSKKPDASFAVTKDPAAVGSPSLAAYVDKQIVDMAKTCPRFELIRREPGTLDGLAVEQIEFTWRSPEGTSVKQQQWVVIVGSGVALTFTATVSQARYADYASVFDGFMRSLTFRR